MLLVVHPGLRLGTSGFLPCVVTGWKEMAELANSRRVFVCVIWRGRHDEVNTVSSAWHLKQTSYSKLAASTGEPDALIPLTEPISGWIVGADAEPGTIVCGSWQSAQVACAGIGLLGSTGLNVSWTLNLLRSERISCAPDTEPSWQVVQVLVTLSCRSKNGPLGEEWVW